MKTTLIYKSACEESCANGHGIGQTWDPFWDRCDLPYDSSWERTDMGLSGHGIPSGIVPSVSTHFCLYSH